MTPKLTDWRAKARWEVMRATYSSNPDDAPVYRIPKHRPWWQFWKPLEWEEVRGISRAQWQRVEDAMRADRAARVEIMNERGVTDPMANIYAPWVTEALAARQAAPQPNSEGEAASER